MLFNQRTNINEAWLHEVHLKYQPGESCLAEFPGENTRTEDSECDRGNAGAGSFIIPNLLGA